MALNITYMNVHVSALSRNKPRTRYALIIHFQYNNSLSILHELIHINQTVWTERERIVFKISDLRDGASSWDPDRSHD